MDQTAGGVPFGCHSRPPFLKFPTSSFFFVREITGCGEKRVRTVALTCYGLALRSGWRPPPAGPIEPVPQLI